ncbi:LuxR C-terminal-related transcriptional regulator [Streptomyces sp. NBC_01715]|uniref:response regulator transcription factor n=1 Tax=Streptomyces sp. NBC_01715 TaxID=2975916 RepID=UPI003FCD360C
MSNGEIAQALTVSEHTVKTHVQNMLHKLRLRNRVHAAIYAFESGLRPRPPAPDPSPSPCVRVSACGCAFPTPAPGRGLRAPGTGGSRPRDRRDGRGGRPGRRRR